MLYVYVCRVSGCADVDLRWRQVAEVRIIVEIHEVWMTQLGRNMEQWYVGMWVCVGEKEKGL